MTKYELLKRQDPKQLRRRIMAKIEKTSDGCWEWQGWNMEGYAMMSITSNKNTKTFTVPQVLWWIEGRALPRGMRLAHICNNVACVNPDHMVVERHAGGRRPWSERTRGEEHGNSKLNEDKVREMRRLRRWESKSYVELGEMFDVSEGTARRACIRQTWKHVK